MLFKSQPPVFETNLCLPYAPAPVPHTAISEQEASSSDPTTIENRVASSLPSTLRSSPASALSLATDPTSSPVVGTSLSRLLAIPLNLVAVLPVEEVPHHIFRVVPFGVLRTSTTLSVPEKQSNISCPRDPLHLTHVDFNPSTGKFTNLYYKITVCPRPNGPRSVRPFTRPTSLMLVSTASRANLSIFPRNGKDLCNMVAYRSPNDQRSAHRPYTHHPVVLDPSTGEFIDLPEEWQHFSQHGSTPRSKRPEINTLSNITYAGLNRTTGKFTGLPGKWQQRLEGSGISKSRWEKNSLTIMKAVKFHQGNGANVCDTMGCISSTETPSVAVVSSHGTVPPF